MNDELKTLHDQLQTLTNGMKALYKQNQSLMQQCLSLKDQQTTQSASLALRPLTSDETTELDIAFCEAQGESSGIAKDKDGHQFKYMSLDSIITTIRPLLKKHGLSFRQYISYNGTQDLMITRLHHTSGQWAESCMRINPGQPGRNRDSNQEFGSTLTYAKRYSLVALLGLATGDPDLDN